VVVVVELVVVVLVVVELVELVEVLLVVPGTQTDSRHSPTWLPATGGVAQGQFPGQGGPTGFHPDPSHRIRQRLPQPGVVLVVGGRVVGGGGQGHGQGVVPQTQ
jgi:hypothetical protein